MSGTCVLHCYCYHKYFSFFSTHVHAFVSSTVPTFSSLSSMTGGSSSSGSTFGRVEGGREVQPVEEGRGEEGKVGGGGEGSGGEEGGVGESKAAGAASSSSSVVPVLLPEVQRVTGEEGEMKIVQVCAYVGRVAHYFFRETCS